MAGGDVLLKPEDCVILFVDFQAGLGFAVESTDRQVLLNNAIALARTSVTFNVPVVASASASKVYSGPMFPALQAAIPAVKPIERKNMNAWEDETVRQAVLSTKRKRLIVAGLLTEACVSFPILSALKDGLEAFAVADTCGGLTQISHELALRRMQAAGAQLTSWIQVLLEFQRDWTRHATYEAARAIVVANGGGYGMGLAYARDMIHQPYNLTTGVVTPLNSSTARPTISADALLRLARWMMDRLNSTDHGGSPCPALSDDRSASEAAEPISAIERIPSAQQPVATPARSTAPPTGSGYEPHAAIISESEVTR